MPVPQSHLSTGQPTCWQKLKLGFMMGAVIGGATGVVLGSFGAYKSVFCTIN